jgi:tetratricopeptide (TPR) repeat protein
MGNYKSIIPRFLCQSQTLFAKHCFASIAICLFYWILPIISSAQFSLASPSFTALESLSKIYPDSAFHLLKTNLEQAIKKGDWRTEGNCHLQMGEILFHFGQYSPAFEQLLAAENIFRVQNAEVNLAKTLSALGKTYFYNQQPEASYKAFDESFSLFKKRNDIHGMALTLAEIGRLHEKMERYDSAENYQRRALLLEAENEDPNTLAQIYENIGSIMEDQRRYDSAGWYYRLSDLLYEKTGNSIARIEVINNQGDILRKTGRVFESLDYTRRALQLSLLLQEKYQTNSAYRDLAKCFQLLNQYDSGYFYLELSRDLLTELYFGENSKQIAIMQVLSDTERKNTAIIRLTTERRLNITLAIASISVLLLLSLLAAVTISRQRLKIKNERAIREKAREVYQSQKDLMELEIRNKNLEETQLKKELETKTNALSSQLLHLIQKNELLEGLKADLSDLLKEESRTPKKQLRQLLNKINLSFSQDQYWDAFRLVFDQVHQSFFEKLLLICPELSATELRMLSLLKMNLNSTEMATLLGITPDSLRVTRYRVKKKLQLDTGESLTSFIQAM